MRVVSYSVILSKIRALEAARLKFLPLLMALTFAGCVAGYRTYSAAGGGTDTAVGEQHDVPYPAKDSFVMVQDVLRGEGVLFEAKPEEHLVTQWRPGDQPPGVWGDLVGVNPRYRYEIEVVPTGQRTSRIIVNVHAEDIAPDQIDSYQATKRLSLFTKFDQFASKFPPSGITPREGGVNFALLPGEDLKSLAKRVTGNADNWQEIAKDNGLKSATDLSGAQTIWVPNTLLPQEKDGGAQTQK
jgi:hypothetical protein